MPTDTQPTPADQLADLLDGRIGIEDVSPEVASLAELATQVQTHVTLVPPTDAFRELLRDQLVQASAAPTAATAAAVATPATTATGGGLSALVAGITATAVLATATVTVADRAGPGDLLAGLDRGVEQVQLAIAGDERDVELLVDFATERVLEALDLVDTSAVNGALAEAQDLVDDAIALAVAQGRAVEELLEPYTGALLTLVSRTDDPTVRAQVEQRLRDLGVNGTRPGGADSGSPDQPRGGAGDTSGSDADGDTTTDGADAGSTDDGSTGTDGDDGGDLVDEVEDTVDDLTDDVTDPVDDLTDPLDDVTDPLEDAIDDVTDPLEDAVGGLTGDG